MRLIGGLLLMEVPLAIASAGWRLVLSILAPEALHRCPGLDQCAIHGKVFAGDQALYLIRVQHGVEEASNEIFVQHAFAVLAESRGIPDRIVDGETHEP